MPDTNEIPINVKATADLKGIDETNLALDNLKKNLKSFGEAFQMGKILYQMDQLEEKYKAIGLQVEAATGQIRNSAGTLLSVDQAAKQVADSMNKAANSSVGVAQKIREIKAEFASFTAVEKFKQDMASVGIIVDEVKSKAGVVELRFTTNTGDILSARDAMTKLKTATDAAKIANDKLIASQKQMKTALKGIASIFGSMQNFFLGLGLSMLFLGMQLKKTSETIARSVLDTYQKIVEGGTFASRGMLALGGAFTFLKFVVGDAIATALLPFIPIILDIVDAIADWVDENPELVSTIILGAVALGTFMMIAGQLIIPLGLVGNAIKLLITLFTSGELAAGLASAGEAIAALLAALANPYVLAGLLILIAMILAVIAAVIALAISWEKNINGFRDVVASMVKKVAKFFADLMTEVYKVWKSIFTKNLPEVINNFFNFFRNLWDGNFDAALANLGKFVVNVAAIFAKMFFGIINIFGKIFVTIAGIAVDFFQWLLATFAKLVVRIDGLFRAGIAALIRGAGLFGNAFIDVVKNIVLDFGKGLETMYAKFVSFLNDLINSYNSKVPALMQIGTIKKTTINITSDIGKTFEGFKTTVTNLVEGLAKGVTLTPEQVKAKDTIIDVQAKAIGDFFRGLIGGLSTIIEKTTGADVINPLIDKATNILTTKIEELTGTTERMTEKQIEAEKTNLNTQITALQATYDSLKIALATGKITQAQFQSGVNGLKAQLAIITAKYDKLIEVVESGQYEKDYYVGLGVDKMADSYLGAIASLKNFADSVDKNTNAAVGSTAQVGTFVDGMSKLPMAYITALAKMFMGGDANAIATAENTLALEETGKVNVDNTNMMQNLINTFSMMMTGAMPTLATAPALGGTTTTLATNNNQTTTINVDMSGITATNGSVVIPQASLEKLIQEAVKNSMTTWTENFKQGMNSYGV